LLEIQEGRSSNNCVSLFVTNGREDLTLTAVIATCSCLSPKVKFSFQSISSVCAHRSNSSHCCFCICAGLEVLCRIASAGVNRRTLLHSLSNMLRCLLDTDPVGHLSRSIGDACCFHRSAAIHRNIKSHRTVVHRAPGAVFSFRMPPIAHTSFWCCRRCLEERFSSSISHCTPCIGAFLEDACCGTTVHPQCSKPRSCVQLVVSGLQLPQRRGLYDVFLGSWWQTKI